jgi:DNA-directed RNA polymerase specialized sigma24 family protein
VGVAERDRAAGSSGSVLTADRAVAAVRVHLDRVHDAVLRTGCAPADAVEVVRATALALVERSAAEAASADEAVGRWFADADASGRQVAGPSPALPGDAQQRGLQSALDDLPDRQRLAVLLREAYDLPLPAVAAALEVDDTEAEQLVAEARHSLPAADLHSLTVQGMSPVERSDLLREVQDLADRRLPQARPRSGSRRVPTAVVTDGVPAEPPVRLLSPLLAGLSVVLAVLAGVGVGLLLARQDGPRPLAGTALPSGVAFVSPQPSVTAVPSPPTVAEVRPRTRVVVVPPSPLPAPTPTPTPTPTPSPTAVPALELTPAGGPNATTVAVRGTGFPPGAEVQLDYLDAAGAATGSSAVAVADDSGSITAALSAQDPADAPGPHSVVASVGDTTLATAVFTAQ